MISYRISEKALATQVESHVPGWSQRAKAANTACKQARAFIDKGSLWSEIKAVYMKLQYEKCCYCERKLESKDFGKIEHDVEHFRPKSHVNDWFVADVLADFPDWPKNLRRGGTAKKGYYKLAYDPRNY